MFSDREEIRARQIYVTNEPELARSSVQLAVGALRFCTASGSGGNGATRTFHCQSDP
jgi:hypothetical protein